MRHELWLINRAGNTTAVGANCISLDGVSAGHVKKVTWGSNPPKPDHSGNILKLTGGSCAFGCLRLRGRGARIAAISSRDDAETLKNRSSIQLRIPPWHRGHNSPHPFHVFFFIPIEEKVVTAGGMCQFFFASKKLHGFLQDHQ